MRKLFAALLASSFALGAYAQTAPGTQPQAVTREGGSTVPKAQAAGEAKKDARMDKPAKAKTERSTAAPRGDATGTSSTAK